jgi:uncharacterized protein (TIGR02246 family)
MPGLVQVGKEGLVPAAGAQRQGTEAAAIRKLAAAGAKQMQARNVAGVAALFSPDGFVHVEVGEFETAAVGRDRFAAALADMVADATVEWNTFRAASVRVLQWGAFALAEADYSVRGADGQETTYNVLHALAREEAGWRVAGSFMGLAHVAPMSKDEAEVRRLAQLYVAPVAIAPKVAPEKVAEFVADDVVAVWSDGRAVAGKAQLIARARAAIAEVQQTFKAFDATLHVRHVRMLGTAAIVVGDVRLAGTLQDGEQPWERAIWMTLVFEKRPEGWRLVQEHSTRTTAPPPPPGNPTRGEM